MTIHLTIPRTRTSPPRTLLSLQPMSVAKLPHQTAIISCSNDGRPASSLMVTTAKSLQPGQSEYAVINRWMATVVLISEDKRLAEEEEQEHEKDARPMAPSRPLLLPSQMDIRKIDQAAIPPEGCKTRRSRAAPTRWRAGRERFRHVG